MRILGLDYGQKRIGLALSDEMGWSAQPLEVIERTNIEVDLAAIRGVIDRYGVATVVIGLPRNMNGSLGPAAERVQAFAARLAASTAVETVFWDERLSSVSAERVLIQADVSRAKRKKVVDKLAASIILQGYLDSLPAAGGAE